MFAPSAPTLKTLARFFKFSLIVSALIASGLVVGLMVVFLPPLSWIGVLALALIFFFWVMPDLNLINPRHVTILFFIAFTSQIIFPAYYAFALPGLPWISLRRLTWFPLVIAAGLLIASSTVARKKITLTLADAKAVSIFLGLFIVFQFLSIFTSYNNSESIKDFWNSILYWYFSALIAIYCLSGERSANAIFIIIASVSIIAGISGVVELIVESRFIAKLWPESIIAQLFESNPDVFANITRSIFRGGQWRSNFIYNVSLSYGEFLAICAPVCLHFVLSGTKWAEKWFGAFATMASIAGIYASGSRGAMIGAAISIPLLIVLWVIRAFKRSPGSMIGPIAAAFVLVSVTSFIFLLTASHRFQTSFTGGAEAASSSSARFDQWRLAVPHILSNPVTGHGTGLGAEIVGYAPFGSLTVDSYVISLLVEIGVVGFVAFFALIIYCALLLIRIYLQGTHAVHDYSGPLAAALISFGVDRVVLSQRENHLLFFVLVGMAIVQIASAKRAAAARNSNPSQRIEAAP